MIGSIWDGSSFGKGHLEEMHVSSYPLSLERFVVS